MSNFFDNWGLAIIQCLISLISAYIATIPLRKEFRSRNRIIKKDASENLTAIYLLTIITLCFVLFQTSVSDKAQKIQKVQIDSLKFLNRNLSKELDSTKLSITDAVVSSKIELSNQAADKAISASKELVETAGVLRTLIYGGDDFLGLKLDNGIKSGYLTFNFFNNSSNPQYDNKIIIYDYNKLLQCKSVKYKNRLHYDHLCAVGAETQFPVFSLYSNSTQTARGIFEFQANKIPTKYYIQVNSRSIKYFFEIFIVDYGYEYRIFKLDANRRKVIFHASHVYGLNIDWAREFSFPPIFDTIDIALYNSN
jgi:hypothetical protein